MSASEQLDVLLAERPTACEQIACERVRELCILCAMTVFAQNVDEVVANL